MHTVSAPATAPKGVAPPKRVLALLGDERLVDQIRRGNERAFEVVYERHGHGILSFCRHMLGQLEEAEDAVQHTFASAFHDLQRDERAIKLKPWLYTIARNRCVSVLRARRAEPTEQLDLVSDGFDAQVQRRAELRQLVQDLGELPADQRAALLLSELGDLSHQEVAEVLDCEVPKVKALVFRARSALIDRRQAREIPCTEIREQLATLRGGALRRRELRHHISSCSGCREFRDQVRAQRRMLAAVLPVLPSSSLRASVLGAAGIGGGQAGGGLITGGLGAALGGPLGSAAIGKVALIVALAAAGGATLAEEAVLNHHTGGSSSPPHRTAAAAHTLMGQRDGVGVLSSRAALPGAGLRPAGVSPKVVSPAGRPTAVPPVRLVRPDLAEVPAAGAPVGGGSTQHDSGRHLGAGGGSANGQLHRSAGSPPGQKNEQNGKSQNGNSTGQHGNSTNHGNAVGHSPSAHPAPSGPNTNAGPNKTPNGQAGTGQPNGSQPKGGSGTPRATPRRPRAG